MNKLTASFKKYSIYLLSKGGLLSLSKFVVIVMCSSIFISKTVAQDISDIIKYKLDSIQNNVSGRIYFFNEVELSEIDFYRKAFAGELDGLMGSGVDAGKKSIIRYGERYRLGVTFFNSVSNSGDIKVKDRTKSLFVNKTFNMDDSLNVCTINGKIDDKFNDDLIMLFSFDEDSIKRVDTTRIANGQFVFNVQENLDDISILSVGNFPDSVASLVVFLDKGNIKVNMSDGIVVGTPLNDLYQECLDKTQTLVNEMNDLPSDGGQGVVVYGSPRHHKLIEIGEYTVGFKKQNIHNIVGQYLFEKEAGKTVSEPFAYPNTKTSPDSAFYIIYNEASESYKQKGWIKEYIEFLKKESYLIEAREALEGDRYIDFTLTDLLGDSKSISDYVGESRYILLDFWASWCGPCIASFPKLKEVYDKYDRSDLEIIGVSIDTDKNKWLNTVAKHELPWKQLATLDLSLNNEIQKKYAFKGIPFTVLLDVEGNIIATYISMELLSHIIDEIK